MRIAGHLDDFLKAKSLQKIEFAEMLHKRPAEITTWVSGTHHFTINILTKIAAALDISVSELLQE